MRTIRAERSKGLRRKICVACGYDGPAIRGDLDEIGYACPQCSQDLYARPPMSYAEMEGFAAVMLLEEISIELPEEPMRPRARWWARLVTSLQRLVRAKRSANVGNPDQPSHSTSRTRTSG
jgi:hypothetical protein